VVLGAESAKRANWRPGREKGPVQIVFTQHQWQREASDAVGNVCWKRIAAAFEAKATLMA